MSSLRGLLPQRSTTYAGKVPPVGGFLAAWVEVNFTMGTFKKNTAVTGFTFVLLSATDGSAVTTGTPVIYVTKDGGTQATIVGSATHEGNGQWSFNLTAAEMNADMVGLLITETGSIAINHTILTDTSIISEVKTDTDAILVDTGTTLPADLATIDTNVDAVLVDTGTTLPAQISALNDFDPTTDGVDVTKINGSTEAAQDLSASALTIVRASAVTGTLSTTEMTTDLTEATDDHYNGRIIIWTSGVLKDQATAITDYTGASKKLTFVAITEAPSNADTFVIV